MRLILLLLTFCFSIQICSQNNDDQLTPLVQKAYQHFYTNQDSAYYYFEEIKKIAAQDEDLDNVIIAHISINRVASHFYNLEKMKSSLNKLDLIFKNKEKAIDSLEYSDVYKNSFLFDKGIYNFEVNDYKSSKRAFHQLIETLEKVPDSIIDRANIDLLSQAYNYIAKMHADEAKFHDAEQYYYKNIRYINTKKPDDQRNLNKTYSLLAETFRKENKHAKSNQYFIKALRYHLENKGDKNSIISVNENIIENHIILNQKDSANYYLAVLKENLTEDHPFLYKYFNALAEINIVENNYEKALEALNEGLKILNAKGINTNFFNIAYQYLLIGNLNSSFGKFNQALMDYDLALEQLSNKSNKTTDKTLTFKILKRKIEALNEIKQFEKSIKTTDQAIAILDELKPSFKNDSDKLFLLDAAFPVFESGIQACFHLYETTKQDSFINKAFHYAEKSKSVLLLESILGTKATEFANIPKAIIEKEQILKSEINRIEKKLNTSSNQLNEDLLFQLKTEHRNLINTIEVEYTSYYNLKYNSKVINLDQVQNTLNPETILVSYFYGNEAIYTVTISENSKQFTQYTLDANLEKDINTIYQMLNNPKSNLKTLNDKSYNLYSKLVAPSLKNNRAKNLVIIPDGLLNYIPFSSLNTTKNDTKYLIEDYSVSYINSATLMQQLSEKKATNNNVLAFAPSFNVASSTLLPLPNNDTEAKNILKYFKGKTLTSNRATLQNFHTESSFYGILHFATHAIVNDETPRYSYLAFQPNDTHSNVLYVSDLYNLNLNSNLVTLSACESGIGSLKRGEGFMSLARGFYFSGASSISSTLWKINDASALKIMDAFYKNLSQAKTKNRALQNAQLDFIHANKQNALVHPYYWSGFVISGNTSALVTNSNWVWYLLVIVAFILIGVIIKKRKNLIKRV